MGTATATLLWLFGHKKWLGLVREPGEWDDGLTALCLWHGCRFEVSVDMLGGQIDCPKCGKPLRLNEFVCDPMPKKPWWRFW